MIFKQTRIPYGGREKYPSNQAGNSIASFIKSYLGGGGSSSPATTASTEYNSTENRGTNATSYSVSFDHTSMNVPESALTGTYTESFTLMARAGLDTADTLIGDLSTSAISNTYGITGLASFPIQVGVSNNGTSATTLSVSFTGNPSSDEFYLVVPVNVNINSNKIDPYHPVWYDNLEKIQTTNLKITWHIDRTAQVSSVYSLSLSNDNASIICDSAGTFVTGTTLPTCKGKLYYGSQLLTGATYDCDTSQFTAGVSTAVTQGVLTISFNNSISFTGDVASVIVSGKVQNTVVDVKTMNITKAKAGATGGVGPQGPDGVDATIYWIMTNTDSVLYNPNSGTVVPSGITVSAYTQTGTNPPTLMNLDTYLTYEWISRRSGTGPGEEPWESGQLINNTITATSATVITYNKLRLRLYSDSTHRQLKDMEDIDLLMDGTDGIDGSAGRTGAAVRGPYNWYDISGDSRYFYAGEESVYPDSEKWIDVILKDGVYYYCIDSVYFDSSQEDWSYLVDYFETGETMNFVAANLILANNAKIKFLTGNQIYMEDSAGTITAGVYGGNGSDIAFWAGNSEADPKFSVDHDGNLVAKEGRFYGNVFTPFKPVSELTSTGTVTTFYGSKTYRDAEYNGQIISDLRAYSPSDTNYPIIRLPIPTSAYYGFTYTISAGRGFYQASTTYGFAVIPYNYGASSVIASNRRFIYDFTFNTTDVRESFNGIKVLGGIGNPPDGGAILKITCMPYYYENEVRPVWGLIESQGTIANFSPSAG